MSLSPERRRQLQGLGLRALVKRRFGEAAVDDARPVRLGTGVGLLMPSAEGPLAAVFADDPMSLGAAIDAAHREGATRLLFFAERNTGDTARRAAEFVIDTSVIDPEADVEAFAPSPVGAPAQLPAALDAGAAMFADAGLDVVWEHGVLLGEYLGLEVARAVVTAEGVVLDVGVGKHDREASRLFYADGPTLDVVVAARRTVADLRRPGAPPHPANQLVPERWLRAVLIRRPDLVGMQALAAAEPPTARSNLRERGIAPALGEDAVVVSSVGIDPDLVPEAADARLHLGADRRLLIVVPEGDDHPLTHRLVALLRRPAELVTVPAAWRALLG